MGLFYWLLYRPAAEEPMVTSDNPVTDQKNPLDSVL